MGFSRHIPHCAGFTTPVEVLVTVRSNIYYLSHSLLDRQSSGTSKREWKSFIFLTPLSAFKSDNGTGAFYENMYSKNAKRVLRKPARETHAPIKRLGSRLNQYGDGLLTRQNTCVVNWIQSNIIRLLELGFELQQFFYLLVNTWLYSWSRNSRTWHSRSREKSGTGLVR